MYIFKTKWSNELCVVLIAYNRFLYENNFVQLVKTKKYFFLNNKVIEY